MPPSDLLLPLPRASECYLLQQWPMTDTLAICRPSTILQLWTPCSVPRWLLVVGPVAFYVPYLKSSWSPSSLLWLQWNSTHLLWLSTSLWAWPARTHPLMSWWTLPSMPSSSLSPSSYYGVLWKNHWDCAADKNDRRKKEGLLYMCFPSYCGPHLLWEHHLHVCAAEGELFIDPWSPAVVYSVLTPH